MSLIHRSRHYRPSIAAALVIVATLMITTGLLGLAAVARHIAPDGIKAAWMMALVIAGVLLAVTGFAASTMHKPPSTPVEHMAATVRKQAKRDMRRQFGRM